MAHSSDHIWQLVHQLSSKEKSFFRRDYSKPQGANNQQEPLYLKLFDAINKQQEYNEQKLIRLLAPALTAKNISYTKNYLQEQICQALLVLHTDNNVDAGLYQQLSLIHILREKGLYKAALKIWQTAIKRARAFENYPLIQQLKDEYRRIQLYNNPKATYQDLEGDYAANIMSMEEYAKLIHLQELHFKALLLRRKSHFRQTNEDQKLIEELLESRLLTNPIVKHSFLYRHYYNMTKAILLYLQNDAHSYTFAYENVHDWQQQPERIAYDQENYIEVLYIFYYTAVLAKDYQHVIDIMQHSANKKITGEIHRAYFETVKHLALNRVYNKLADYNKVEVLVTNMKKNANHWEQYINTDLQRTLRLSIGIACFVLRDYDNAYHYIKNAVLLFNDATRTEHYSFAYLFLLIICFEKKDHYLFDLQYKSTYSYFYRKEKPLPFEKATLQTLHKAFNAKDFKTTQQLFSELYDMLKLTANSPVQQQVFSIFNVPVWLESKIYRVPYKEWVMKKVRESLAENKSAS